MKKIRINELARELEVKAHEILDRLPELGVTEKKTHSSSIDEDVALKLRKYYGFDAPDYVHDNGDESPDHDHEEQVAEEEAPAPAPPGTAPPVIAPPVAAAPPAVPSVAPPAPPAPAVEA